MNFISVVILILVAAAFIAAVRYTLTHKDICAEGCGSCGISADSCGGCPLHGYEEQLAEEYLKAHPLPSRRRNEIDPNNRSY